MDLLGEIISASIDDSVRLAVILRRCRVLAAELGNDSLKAWVLNELNGYQSTDDLPDYRVLRIGAKGFFIGPLGSSINDQPLASGVLDQEHRWWATTSHMMQAVASYEALVEANDSGSLRADWPADMVAHYQNKFIDGYVLNRAWQEIPISGVVAFLDTVRNRVLEFALEMRGEAGVSDQPTPALPPEKVQSAVTNIILGGSNIVAAHVDGGVQLIGNLAVIKGDFFSLSQALADLGVPDQEVHALEQAIEEDKQAGAPQGFGERTRAWLGKAIMYVGKGGAKIVGDVATAALTRAVSAYFGLPPS